MKMIRIFFSLLLAGFTLSFSSCQTTGNVVTDLQGFWNSPNVQTELQSIQTMAFNFVTAFVTAHIGGTTKLKASSPVVIAATDQYVTAIKAKFPDAPDSVIRNAVTTNFANALK
jgi:hypothetical protein